MEKNQDQLQNSDPSNTTPKNYCFVFFSFIVVVFCASFCENELCFIGVILVHDYADINPSVLWQTLNEDLESLKAQLLSYINE